MDSDAFLTLIESKLRGPFTSIDFAKAVSSGSCASNEYLTSVLSVLPRAEKVTQLRILIGLLGLEPSELLDNEIQHILTTTQNGPMYEEWVRVISGIVEDILCRHASDITNKNEANRLVDKTSSEIIIRLKELERRTPFTDEETELLGDSSPLFVPYRYNLLSPCLITSMIPNSKAHSHFSINTDSETLLVDMNMEIEKTKEEHDHHVSISTHSKLDIPAIKRETEASSQLPQSSDRKLASARVKTSSMFMPSKPHSGVGRVAVGTRTALKPQLHQRKAGAAQALLAKGRIGRMMQTVAGNSLNSSHSVETTEPRQISGRSAVTSAISSSRGTHKSKMKMIDVAEVQGLETKKQQIISHAPLIQRTMMTPHASTRKRPHEDIVTVAKGRKKEHSKMASPAEKSSFGHELKLTVKTDSNVSPAETDNAGELASAALLAYQSRAASLQPTGQSSSIATGFTDSSFNLTKQQDWRELLQLRSNRLTEDDRQRIQHFFVDRYNPTPKQRQYKMKLHEERTTDPLTGKAMKETYYLDLDYDTYTSTHNKKVKRYDDN